MALVPSNNERILSVEENHNVDSDNLLRSMGSSIKIDSISIELINASDKENKDAEKCEHFSIRGYVSEIRKSSWKKCNPFTADHKESNSNEELTDMLPPLHVPKFKLWCCQSCLLDIGATISIKKDHEPAFKSCSCGINANSSCSHARTTGTEEMLSSDFQQPPKLDVCGEVKTDTQVGLNNTSKCHPSSSSDGKEMKNDITSLTKVIKSSIQKTQPSAACKSKGKECGDIHKPDFVQQEVADVEFARELNSKAKCTPKSCELVSNSSTREADNLNKPFRPIKGHRSVQPSFVEDDIVCASSEGAKIMSGNDLQAVDDDDSSGLHRKKARKVRLLTELLCENEDKTTDKLKDYDALTREVNDCSAGVVEHRVLQCELDSEENTKRVLVRNRKRKSLEDGCWKPKETSSTNEVCKEILKVDAQSSDKVSGHEIEEDSFARAPQTVEKSPKCRIDRNPNLGKKSTKTRTVEGHLPLIPAQENVPSVVAKRVAHASKENIGNDASFKIVQNGFMGREMGPFPLSVQTTEMIPSSTKKQTKTPQVDDHQVFLMPLNHDMRRDDPMTRNVVEDVMNMRPLSVPLHPVDDRSIGKELNHSLNAYMSAQYNGSKCVSRIGDLRTSFSAWPESTSSADEAIRRAAEKEYAGHCSSVSKFTPNVNLRNGMKTDLHYQNDGRIIPFPTRKQNYTSQFEMGASSLVQQKDFHNRHNKEKSTGSKKDYVVARKDYDQGADKHSEQGVSDDIPMEIVELMAKNQYERHLADAEYERRPMETTHSITTDQRMDANKMHGQRELSLLKPETSQKRRLQAKSRKNGIIKKGENMGSSRQKSIDYFHQPEKSAFNIGHLEQTRSSASGAFFHCREKPLAGPQNSSSSFGGKTVAPSFNWVRDVMGKTTSNTNLQGSGPCNSGMSIPLQSKKTNDHLCPSMMPNRMPIMYTIPQKCVGPSTDLNVFSQSPRNMHKGIMNGNHELNFLNQHASSVGKQNWNFGSETIGRGNAGYPYVCKHNRIGPVQKPMGSVDFYSNETIPAMHLLSLMDAGLQSNAPTSSMDATPRSVEGSTLIHNHGLREFSGVESGIRYGSTTIKHPSYVYEGQNKFSENFHQGSRAITAAIGASPSLQRDKKRPKKVNFASEVSPRKERKKVAKSGSKDEGCRSEQPAYTISNLGTNYQSTPVYSMQTLHFGGSEPIMFPLQSCTLENLSKRKLDAPSTSGTIRLNNLRHESQICSVNRNPADFSIPEPGNDYMIAGEHLKVAKTALFPNKSGAVKLDGQKRQKKKLPAMKERGQHLTT